MDSALEPDLQDRAMSRAADSAASEGNARTRRKAGVGKRKLAASEPAVAPKAEARLESKADTKPDSKPAPEKKVRRKVERASALETTIGYRFRDKVLLERALTHISALKGQGRTGSYQRLEFLGDHVLGLAVSEMLFASFPKAEEGELSRRLADLVRRESCADVARVIDLGASLRLGASEVRAGGRSRIAILADVCESLIGAVFLDGGYKAAKALVERYWSDRMRTPVRPLRDPKTVLQEWAQARGLPTPSYREVERIGPHHDPVFRVSVQLPERDPAEGRGRSKRSAEQAAASALLAREGVNADV
jgi:ribonuclease-3